MNHTSQKVLYIYMKKKFKILTRTLVCLEIRHRLRVGKQKSEDDFCKRSCSLRYLIVSLLFMRIVKVYFCFST